jgi:hypothetical protein
VKNRPNSICYDKAVYNSSGLTVNFDIANNYDLLSGISNHIDFHKSSVDENKETIQVQTISLLDVLNNANAPSFIEYMSLDTEGSEFEILKNLDFEKYTFGLIDVEHNYIEPRRTEINNLLLSKGYIYKITDSKKKCYIGSTIDSRKRWIQHEDASEDMPLHRAIKEQGIENFTFDVVKEFEFIDTNHLLIIESCCMDQYDSITNGFNTKHSVCMFDLY